MSPTAPTFITLNDQLNKAHRRIRELQARETELLAQNRTLRAVITELTHDDPAQTAAELCSSPLHTSSPNDGSDGRFGTGDRGGKHTTQRLGPTAQSPAHADTPPRSRHWLRIRSASKRRGPKMFDLDPIGAMFLIIAVLWLIAAVAYGRDNR
jgi:hypothetical protein